MKRMMRRTFGYLVLLILAASCTRGVGAPPARAPVVVGAVYPTGGGQGPGGIDEYRGVRLAAELANRRGGVGGRSIRIRLARADSADAAPGAVRRLTEKGAAVIMGSYGSTISRPAAQAAARRGLVFWETGAVGELSMSGAPEQRFFRFPLAGASLGREAVAFVRDQLASHLPERELRYSVAYVDDVYGRAVGEGALEEISRSGLVLADRIAYQLSEANYEALAARIRDAGTDVLVVGAYLEDGVALRRAIVRTGVPLAANIGTSSSYCMHEFGKALGADAVGVFASDKPDGDVLAPENLKPEARETLRWARKEYRLRHGGAMSAPALSGFAAGWALFHHVLPEAPSLSSDAIVQAARSVRLPVGALPNGSGLEFGPAGSPLESENLAATSVIWEWTAPNTRSVVWPPAFATSPIIRPS
ncbi:MAG: ABC transporter substrate-binding protein [Actinomycetota bacterium]